MSTTINRPVQRIDPWELSKDKFTTAGIKLSTKKRLKEAHKILGATLDNQEYQLLENALELFYFNTTVFYAGENRLLIDVINEIEGGQ